MKNYKKLKIFDIVDSHCFAAEKVDSKLSVLYIASGVGAAFVLLVFALYCTRNWWIKKIRICYKMKSIPRGICLIVANENFGENSRLMNRPFHRATLALKDVFEKLHYETLVKNNQTAFEIDDVLKGITVDRLLMVANSLICIVLGYSDKHDKLYCADGRTITIHSVLKGFNDEFCLFLRNKPKIFFFITDLISKVSVMPNY